MSDPNFFLAGAPKSGTSALFDYLWAHPNAFTSTPKEPHFFCSDFPGLARGKNTLEDYLELFATTQPKHTAIGEASVLYLYSDVAFRKIHDFNSAAKIILMARNPIELVQSWHNQMVYTLNETAKNFEDAWRLQQRRRDGTEALHGMARGAPVMLQYEIIGKIGERIRHVYDIFPENQILLLFMEDLKARPADVYRETLAFLSLPEFELPSYPVVNPSKKFRSRRLAAWVERKPNRRLKRVGDRLKKLVGKEQMSFRTQVAKLNCKPIERRGLSQTMENTLRETFRDDIRELEKLSGRNLELWLQAQ